MLNAADLNQFSSPEGESDRWYWAAPLLLDHANVDFRQITEAWFSNPESLKAKPDSDATEEEEQSGAKREHFDLFMLPLNDEASAEAHIEACAAILAQI